MITFIPNRCQPWLYKKAECRLCLDACPVKGCIYFEDGVVSVNTEDCIGCGICTTVCPTSALVMESLSDRELWNRLQANRGEGSLLFSCYLHAEHGLHDQQDLRQRQSTIPTNDYSPFKSEIQNHPSDSFINLPCLALLKESHLISLVLTGVNSVNGPFTEGSRAHASEASHGVKNIYLDVSRCSACSFRQGKKTIDKTVSYARNLLDTVGYHDCIKTIEIPLKDFKADEKTKKSRLPFRKNKTKKVKTILPGSEYSRRDLLHFLGEKAVEKAVERVTGSNRNIVKGGVGEEQDVPERRALLFEALKKIDAALKPGQIEDGMFPIHQLRIGENCTLCNICNLACPTGAIMKVNDSGRVERGGEVRIDFTMSLCMDCYQCTELCPEGALYNNKGEIMDITPLMSGEAMTLFKKTSKACPTCSSVFYPEDGVEQCSVCRKKNKFDQMFENLYSSGPFH